MTEFFDLQWLWYLNKRKILCFKWLDRLENCLFGSIYKSLEKEVNRNLILKLAEHDLAEECRDGKDYRN
jgi:hypothetical protein